MASKIAHIPKRSASRFLVGAPAKMVCSSRAQSPSHLKMRTGERDLLAPAFAVQDSSLRSETQLQSDILMSTAGAGALSCWVKLLVRLRRKCANSPPKISWKWLLKLSKST